MGNHIKCMNCKFWNIYPDDMQYLINDRGEKIYLNLDSDVVLGICSQSEGKRGKYCDDSMFGAEYSPECFEGVDE